MLSLKAVKMWVLLSLLLATACALADKTDNRRNKLPFVADAVGNSLPPPSNVPATVGSPVNLLTPDRYEFYTFDESGELVKRLMTLEEIQAIVAAGEEAEGLVTFANENQPTVSFNVNQPPHTKIHSVVTNVQNVLKAQMEAHKNKPHVQPTLDTPDVSDSWSLILPSIFGNTGVDIVLDKSSGAVTTPDIETLEEHVETDENSLSKEGENQVLISSTTKVENKVAATDKTPVKDKNKVPSTIKYTTRTTTTSTTTTTTARPKTVKPTTAKPTSLKPTTSKATTARPATSKATTAKPTPAKFSIARSTTTKPTTAKFTTAQPTTVKFITTEPTTAKFISTESTTAELITTQATTAKFTTAPPTTVKPTTVKPTTIKSTTATPTTTKPTTIKLTTAKPITTVRPATTTTRFFVTANIAQTNRLRSTTTTPKPTTLQSTTRTTNTKITASSKLEVTTKKPIVNVSTVSNIENEKILIQPNTNTISNTERNENVFEKISTFIPISTVNYVTDRTTLKPTISTQPPVVLTSTTKRPVTTTTTTTTNAPTIQTTKVQTIVTTIKPVVTETSSTSVKVPEEEKFNITTITTQSVSPSTTVSSTEFLSADKVDLPNNIENKPIVEDFGNNEPLLLFDVAQSFSQIASDLGGSFQPIPTTSDLLDTTKLAELDLESKENVEMDIPSSPANETNIQVPNFADKNNDNFIKISTIDPHNKNEEIKPEQKTPIENNIENNNSEQNEAFANKNNNIIIDTVQKVQLTSTQANSEPTTIDPILSESMGDLLSQIVNQAPSIVEAEKKPEDDSKTPNVEKQSKPSNIETIKNPEVIPAISNIVKKDTILIKNATTVNIAPDKEPVKEENKPAKIEKEPSKIEKEPSVIEKEISKIEKVPFKINNESDISKNTETSEKKKVDTVSTSELNDIKISVKTKVNRTESNEQNFVQISGSAIKTYPIIETRITGNNSSKNSSTVNYIESKKEVTQTTPELLVINEKTKISQTEVKDTPSVKITTTLSGSNITESTTQVNKDNPPKTNKITINDKTTVFNKKDKFPEPLPKVDDFKKKIQKINIDEEELIRDRNNSWKLVPTLSPPKVNEILKDKLKSDNHSPDNENKDIVLEFSNENQGLEVTTKDLGEDMARFSELSNELAFKYWNVIVDDIDKRRSFVFSPYSTFSMLAMIFMGARGATSGEMNEILKLDDMVTFNPHFTLKNISDSIETSPRSGVAVSAFIRELYSDRNKGKILTFYKERAQHFYNGHVEEINFKLISDIIRRRTNLLVKRYSWGKIPEYMKTNNIVLQPPLAGLTTNIFQTDCSGTSVDGRDGEMYFVVSPNVRQRRLVPVPAVVYKKGFLAGYDPVLDVTVAALGNTNTIVSTMFLMPGQQGNVVHADDLEKLEQRLLDASPTTPTWNRVLRTLLPRTGLELQIPRFSHKSTFNTSLALKKMGLKDLFDGENADLGGLNGPSKDLYVSDMVQLNTFVTCGEAAVGDQHHIEEYPETLSVAQRRRARWLNDWDEPRDYQRAFHDPHDISDAMHLPLHLRPRQARLPARSNQPARLKFDRPFLFFVRHNPSGMILYFGRYNPRLLP